jgi:probable phosphoglycerate mutase
MKQIRIFIARHGETDYNKKGLLQGRGIDAPLNEAGFRQAEMLSDYLSGYDADQLVSSSLTRTWQTAEPLRKAKKLQVLKETDLDEMDFGEFEGKPYMDAAEELDNIQSFWKRGELDVPIPGGESPRQVFERANNAFHHILGTFSGSNLMLVLHGRLIRVLISEWIGLGLKNMHKVDHQNGAVNQLVYDGSFRSVYLNKTEHLYP